MLPISPLPQPLNIYNKGGTVITGANGLAYVEFATPIPYGLGYVVTLTCPDVGDTVPVVARPYNLTEHGFTIKTYVVNRPVGTGQIPCVLVIQAGVTVYWRTSVDWND